MHFEALEKTLRLRLVSGPADKSFFNYEECADHYETVCTLHTTTAVFILTFRADVQLCIPCVHRVHGRT